METKENTRKIRKRNMRLFPIYKMLSWDLLFYYTINFLFLIQIKNISASDIVLIESFQALFVIILQIPINIMITFIGRKKSLVLGNISLVIYIMIIIFSRNIFDLILANFISAIGFGIKETIQAVLLKESIPPSKYKNQIFSKLNSKGATGYYIMNMISKIVAGYLFTINGYLPMTFTLIILIITTVMAISFKEPIENVDLDSRKNKKVDEFSNIKVGFKFIMKSERVKALIIAGSFIYACLTILGDYEINLLKDINLSAITIGYAGATSSLVSALASKNENKFNKMFKNKSLTILSLLLSISAIIMGSCGNLNISKSIVGILIILSMYMLLGFVMGMYYTIIDRYLMNFTNKEIDTKVKGVYNLFRNIFKCIYGFLASFILGITTSSYALIIVGIIFTIVFILVNIYMKPRVGLEPERYSKEERKYDELKN